VKGDDVPEIKGKAHGDGMKDPPARLVPHEVPDHIIPTLNQHCPVRDLHVFSLNPRGRLITGVRGFKRRKKYYGKECTFFLTFKK